MNILASYITDLKKIKPISREEEKILLSLIKAGDREAFNRFVEGYLVLVVKIAKSYMNHKIPLCDLIQAGNLGVIRAIQKYDPEKSRFTTYATFWIKQYIYRLIGLMGNDVHYPWHYMTENQTMFFNNSVPLEVIPDEGHNVLTSLGHTPDFDRPYHHEKAYELLSRLEPNEELVLRLRHGITSDPQTLRKIGKLMNISHERVRQIQNEAIAKLQKICEKQELQCKKKALSKPKTGL